MTLRLATIYPKISGRKEKILNQTPTTAMAPIGKQSIKSQLKTNIPLQKEPMPIIKTLNTKTVNQPLQKPSTKPPNQIKNQPTINPSFQLKQNLKTSTSNQPQSPPAQTQMRKGANQFNPMPNEQKFTPSPPPFPPEPTPQVPPPPQLQTDQSLKQQPEPKSTKSRVVKFLITFIFTLIFSISGTSLALAYTNYSIFPLPKPIKNAIDSVIVSTPLPKTPRMIINKTVGNMAKVETAVLETQIAMDSQKPNSPINALKITVKGPAEFQNRNQKRSEADIVVEIETEGLKLSGSGTIKIIGDILYFKITEVPAGSFFPADSFKNQWYFIKIDNLESKIYEQDPQIIKKRQEVFEKFLARSYQWTKKVDSQNNSFYTLKLTPPQKEIETLVFDLVNTLDEESQTELEESITRENLTKALSYLQNPQATLVINKEDYLFEAVTLSLNVNIDSLPDLSTPSQVTLPSNEPLKIDFSLNLKFSDYNKPVIIEIPENAHDISEILDNYLDLYNNPLSPETLPPSLQPTPETPSTIQDLLESSEVLGEKTYWDLKLLEILKPNPN